jgi:hypothetical protein
MSLAVFSVCEQPAAKTNSTILMVIIAIPVICPILLICIKNSPTFLYCIYSVIPSFHSEVIFNLEDNPVDKNTKKTYYDNAKPYFCHLDGSMAG